MIYLHHSFCSPRELIRRLSRVLRKLLPIYIVPKVASSHHMVFLRSKLAPGFGRLIVLCCAGLGSDRDRSTMKTHGVV